MKNKIGLILLVCSNGAALVLYYALALVSFGIKDLQAGTGRMESVAQATAQASNQDPKGISHGQDQDQDQSGGRQALPEDRFRQVQGGPRQP